MNILNSKKEIKTINEKEKITFAIDICKFLDEKKAQNILLLDLNKINNYFNFFILTTANSIPHLNSLSNDLYKNFGRDIYGVSQKPTAEESISGWVVVDMIDIVIHLFLEDKRSFYKLERLWGDAKILFSN